MKKFVLIIFVSIMAFSGFAVAQQPGTEPADGDIRELLGLYSCSAYYKLLATQNKSDADLFTTNAIEMKNSAAALLADLQKNPYAEKQLNSIDVNAQGTAEANQWLAERVKQSSGAIDQHLIICQILLDKYRLVYLLDN